MDEDAGVPPADEAATAREGGDSASAVGDAATTAQQGADSTSAVGDVAVFGVAVDEATRCAHYDTDRDVVAIRFACCEPFYPCHACHDAVADHDAARWPRERFDAPAVLCGACASILSITTYLDCGHECPECGHAFNPGCAAHADRYFDV